MPVEEAVDLVRALPMGSLYCGACDPRAAWSFEQNRLADVIDLLNVISWQLARCPRQHTPAPVERPWMRAERERAQKKAQEVREKMTQTKWKEVE